MKKRNKAIFSLILQLSTEDNEVEYREVGYLRNLASTLNLDVEDTDEIIRNPSAHELIPPSLEQERMMILYYMLFAASVDGELNKDEERRIYLAGHKLGFNQIMLREMIEVMKGHLNTQLPNEALIKIIKKYLN